MNPSSRVDRDVPPGATVTSGGHTDSRTSMTRVGRVMASDVLAHLRIQRWITRLRRHQWSLYRKYSGDTSDVMCRSEIDCERTRVALKQVLNSANNGRAESTDR